MKGSTSVLLRKIVRHLFGILRSFEEWVITEAGSAEQAAHVAAEQRRSDTHTDS